MSNENRRGRHMLLDEVCHISGVRFKGASDSSISRYITATLSQQTESEAFMTLIRKVGQKVIRPTPGRMIAAMDENDWRPRRRGRIYRFLADDFQAKRGRKSMQKRLRMTLSDC
eukprot:TRINITY_DN3063_c0_g1_i1.p2 TRINITY_DN3063_c0_g1~~TRINITY_DN3063_c0_g1_i1.p2  ORF type:complete len:114 (+),score=15.05 TRINITY_DN3063_c0_g1_i1:99-440(+)